MTKWIASYEDAFAYDGSAKPRTDTTKILNEPRYEIVLTFPEVTRFKWETEVLLTNLKNLNFDISRVILLIAGYNNNMENYFKDNYNVQAYTLPDNREYKGYIPSVTAYLWKEFLANNPEKQYGTYLYIDTDVIFRELPTFDDVDASHWLGADCSGYLGAKYVRGCDLGDTIAQKMCDIVGIDIDWFDSISNRSIGAQWIINNPTFEYWDKTYRDSESIWKYFETIKDDTNCQLWTASMWSQLLNLRYFGIEPVIDKQLEFTWATDNVDTWYKNKLYHNAGATKDNKDLFFKGDYIWKEPYGEDFSYVNPDKASIKYVEAINKVKRA